MNSDTQRNNETEAELVSPVTPQKTTEKWEIPQEAASVLKDLDTTCTGILQQLGSLEADYISSKNRLLEDLGRRRQQFKTLLDDSAQKAGLDVVKHRWAIDFTNMTLTRAS